MAWKGPGRRRGSAVQGGQACGAAAEILEYFLHHSDNMVAILKKSNRLNFVKNVKFKVEIKFTL
jgi:hypothetical protein